MSMTGTDNERGRWERHTDESEAALDEREAVLDAVEQSFGQLDEERAASRAEGRQAREQARQVRQRARELRQASAQRRADTERARLEDRWGERHPLGAEFATLAERLTNSADPNEAVRHIVRTATQVVPGADLASMTVLNADGRFRTPVRTERLALRLDEAQYQADEGPCVDATRQRGIGLAQGDDLAAADTPWQRFSPSAVRLGVRSVVAVGLFPQSSSPRLGALNLYAHAPGSLADVDVDITVALASYLAVALVAVSQVDAARQEAANLRQALETRDLIGQAKGIVMADRQVTAEQAFDLLSAASQRLNVKLRDLAEQIVQARRS
jgi:hypothetical protein